MLFSYKIRMKCGALAHIEGKLFAQKKKKRENHIILESSRKCANGLFIIL